VTVISPRLLLLIVCLAGSCGAATPLSAQTTEAAAAATPTAAPIPVAEIASRAGEVAATLHEVEGRLQPDPIVVEIAAKLPERAKQISEEAPAALRLLDTQPPLETIESLAKPWQEREVELRGWNDVLIGRSQQLEQILQQLAELNRVWKATRKSLEADTPPTIEERARLTVTAITDTSKAVRAQRAEILTMQDSASAQLASIAEVLRLVTRARALRVQNLFSRDAPPIWELAAAQDQSAEVTDRLRMLGAAQSTGLVEFARNRWSSLALHLAGVLVLAFLLVRARRSVHDLVEQANVWIEVQILELPFSTAVLLGLSLFPWIQPQAPPIADELVGLLALLPVVRLVRQLVGPRLHPWINALACFYVIDRLRAVVATASLLEQLIFLGEMVLAVALLLSLLRPWRIAKVEAEVGAKTARVIRQGGPVLAALFFVAFCASALGFGQLGRLLGGGALRSLYLGITLYAGVRAMEGVLAYLLSTAPLRDLNLVARHRALVFLRLQRVLRWLALAGWLIGTLTSLGLLELVGGSVAGVLGAQFSRGSFTVSIGDLVAFVVTIWLAFGLSRLIRFALEEDVYPRLRVASGVPYALSRLVHYFVLAIGFVVATAMIGIDVDRLALLLGAFGVGIGFGLQNIVNNFVSGIILLFERPVQVGNVVQLGALNGKIERIGIRSSTVRTGDGAEVIVPNATLISDTVTNMTPSDRPRMVAVQVGVAYGSDPHQVTELLESVVRQRSAVLREPAPRALLLRFGESAIDFELQVWIGGLLNPGHIRSDINIAVHDALKQANIEIPFPQREIRLREPSSPP